MNLLVVGRIFFGAAIIGLGLLTLYYQDFPYMIIPYKHSWIPGLPMVSSAFAIVMLVAGGCILLARQAGTASLLLGTILLSIFIFYFIPYQFTVSDFLSLVAWENAEKELALASGAFVVAGCCSAVPQNRMLLSLSRVIPVAHILFSLTMVSFGIIHFQYAKEVAGYVPSWVPFRLFFAYLAGVGLVGSGLSIILRNHRKPAATLLGMMIFSWVLILHVPRVLLSPAAYLGSEVTSTLIALAYSGTAFMIAGSNGKPTMKTQTE